MGPNVQPRGTAWWQRPTQTTRGPHSGPWTPPVMPPPGTAPPPAAPPGVAPPLPTAGGLSPDTLSRMRAMTTAAQAGGASGPGGWGSARPDADTQGLLAFLNMQQ